MNGAELAVWRVLWLLLWWQHGYRDMLDWEPGDYFEWVWREVPA